MNKGFGKYYSSSFKAAFRCLYRKRGNFFRYYAYIFIEMLSFLFFPIRPICKGLNYQIANDVNENRSIALSLGVKNIAGGKTYWSTIVALIYKTFVVIGIVFACLLPASLIAGVAYGVYAYFYYYGNNLPIVLIIGGVPSALVLVIALIYIPIRLVPIGFINNKNPNIDASRSVFISFDAMKKEGKFTLFLIHLVSITLCLLLIALIGVPFLLYYLNVLAKDQFYLVPILMATISIFVFAFLPLFILAAQCSKERLFYDVIQNPKDFKKNLENIVFKRDRNMSTANALVKNFDDVVNQDKLHTEKVKVKIVNYDTIEDEEETEVVDNVSKKEKLQKVKEQKKLQKENKKHKEEQIFDSEPNPEEGREEFAEEKALEPLEDEQHDVMQPNVSEIPNDEEDNLIPEEAESQPEDVKEEKNDEVEESIDTLEASDEVINETIAEEVLEEKQAEHLEEENKEPQITEEFAEEINDLKKEVEEMAQELKESKAEPTVEDVTDDTETVALEPKQAPEVVEEAKEGIKEEAPAEEPQEEVVEEQPQPEVEAEPVSDEAIEPVEKPAEPEEETPAAPVEEKVAEEPEVKEEEKSKATKTRVIAKKPAAKTAEKKTTTKATKVADTKETKTATTKTTEKKAATKAKEEKPKATTKDSTTKSAATKTTKAAEKPAAKTTATKTAAKSTAKTTTKAKAEAKEEPKKATVKVIKAKPKK